MPKITKTAKEILDEALPTHEQILAHFSTEPLPDHQTLMSRIKRWWEEMGTVHYKGQVPAPTPLPTGNIAERHFNPGNLVYMEQEGAMRGELKGDNLYWAKFPDEESGLKAMIKDIGIKVKRQPDMTLKDLILARSPSDENDYKTLAYNVVDELKDLKDSGVLPSLKASQLAVATIPIERLARSLAKAEGYNFKSNVVKSSNATPQ